MALASIKSLANIKSSYSRSKPKFPILNKFSLYLTSSKDSRESSSLRAIDSLPTAIGIFKDSQIEDKSSFMLIDTDPPPVIASIISGIDIFLSINSMLVSISSRETSEIALCSI